MSLRLSTALVAAVFVCLSIMQSRTVAYYPPPPDMCVFPYGTCSSSDPSGETCKERCLTSDRGNFDDGICITDPGSCMCCFGFGDLKKEA
ncbi:Defensin-like protein 99 [Hirschfeldia incana]|nr:Defensin-like protein 99 [Hirschfeldia incana]